MIPIFWGGEGEFTYIESVSSGAYHPDFLGRSKRPAGGKLSNPTDTLTIRSHEWRLTFYTNSNEGELYDLQKDPNEFENRWNKPEYQTIKSELMAKLLNHVAATRDPLPLRTRPY